MEILVKAGQFLLSLSLLIILHELGHFILAKLFKTRVEKFYLFFDPWFSLFKKKIGETEYGIGWLPLGGYVKISGMIDESMDKEQMKQPPKPYEFRSKPSWQRLLIMLGGVLVNFIFAIAIYVLVLHTWGETYLPVRNMTYGIMVDSTGASLGLKNGDNILSVDGHPVENYRSIVHDIVVDDAKTIQVDRNGRKMEIKLPRNAIASLIKSDLPIIPRMPFFIAGFSPDSSAYNAGLRNGDRIIALDGSSTKFFDQFKSDIKNYKDEDVSVTVLRDSTDTLSYTVPVSDKGTIGVMADLDLNRFFKLEEKKYTLAESVPAGIKKGYYMASSYLKQLKLLFKPETKAYEEIGGFIKIGSIFPGVWEWQAFWNMTAFLSLILAIMNILPIPALDGGHVAFLLYEIITGRKPGEKFLEYAQIVGMIILLSLLIYANGNDIIGLFK
ncbi:MAG TPA: RIP metalloprotease RseP [Bacteroidales bacterium]|nr:RIP metalloprotease RseP [Bacteroidales bacterium]